MKVSLAVTVCNEVKEIQRLLPLLLKYQGPNYEVVVMYDTTNGDPAVEQYLRAQSQQTFTNFRAIAYAFDGHFARLKNALTEICTGDYVFQIDADEMPSEFLLENLPALLEANDVDVIRVPRINTVEGLTPEHVAKWGWMVNEQGWVNFPDLQWRIYKKSADIVWINKVHEVLQGYNTMAILPLEEQWCMRHDKHISRQEKQNAYYDTL